MSAITRTGPLIISAAEYHRIVDHFDLDSLGCRHRAIHSPGGSRPSAGPRCVQLAEGLREQSAMNGRMICSQINLWV
jgi:hypothetical protein